MVTCRRQTIKKTKDRTAIGLNLESHDVQNEGSIPVTIVIPVTSLEARQYGVFEGGEQGLCLTAQVFICCF